MLDPALPADRSAWPADRGARDSVLPAAATLAVWFALAGGFSGANALRAEEWPRWRGPRGDGTWQAPPLPESWPASGLRRLWRQPCGGGYAGVIIADGRVFLFDRLAPAAPPESTTDGPAAADGAEHDPAATDVGHEVERLQVFDLATGQSLWSHAYPVQYGKLDYGNGPRAAPTVFDGRVYILGALGHLHCLEAETGRVVWSHDLVREAGAVIPEWGLAASPVIYDELVIVHPGGRPHGCLIAFDRHNGQRRWAAGSDPAGYATPIVARHGGVDQLICWSPEHVLSLEPRSGRFNWTFPYKVTYGVSIATPVYVDGLVVVSGYWEGSKAYRLGDHAGSAALAWEENRWLRGLMSQPLVRGGFAYLLDKQHGLICFEIASGRKLWDDDNRLTPRDRNPQATLVWLGEEGERIIALGAEGELVLARLNPQGYHETSRTKIIGPTWAHPAYAGTCVAARDDRELVCCSLVEAAGGGPPADPAAGAAGR